MGNMNMYCADKSLVYLGPRPDFDTLCDAGVFDLVLRS